MGNVEIKAEQAKRIETYLAAKARSLDSARYRYRVGDGEARAIVTALRPYQNDDGGFGHGIEPDLRVPDSTAIATWMAFQYLNDAGETVSHDVIERALHYFIDTYDEERNGWRIVSPRVEHYAHAPWWDYTSAMSHFGWGNPSAAILGFLLRYRDIVDGGKLIERLRSRALSRITEVDASHFHEVLTFRSLYRDGDASLKGALRTPLSQLIRRAVETSPDAWSGYVATPLTFIASPDDPFRDLFERETLEANLVFLLDTIVDGDHWEPNWNWSGKYPAEWEQAKQDWSGYLTAQNMLALRGFGVVR